MVYVAREKCPEVLQKIKQDYQGEKPFKELFQIIDEIVDFHGWAIEIKSIQDDLFDPKNFCTSPKWMSWQDIRILLARLYYDDLKIHTGGQLPQDEKFENSRMDLEYVWLLAKADVLLTNDHELTAIANAAFPDKKVYSSVGEFTRRG
jgi:hypothetical protein